jgi:ribosomal protein S10
MRIHKRLIDLHTTAEVVKQIVRSPLPPLLVSFNVDLFPYIR